jgi:hypothetical protein
VDAPTATIIAAAITALGSAAASIMVALIALQKNQPKKSRAKTANLSGSDERFQFVVRSTIIGFLFAYGGLNLGTALLWILTLPPMVSAWVINLGTAVLFFGAGTLTQLRWPKRHNQN